MVTSWYHWMAYNSSRIPKMSLILLKKQSFTSSQESSPHWNVNCPREVQWNNVFFMGAIAQSKKSKILFSSNWWVNLYYTSRCKEILAIRNSRNPNMLFQIPILRSWGWDLKICLAENRPSSHQYSVQRMLPCARLPSPSHGDWTPLFNVKRYCPVDYKC